MARPDRSDRLLRRPCEDGEPFLSVDPTSGLVEEVTNGTKKFDAG